MYVWTKVDFDVDKNVSEIICIVLTDSWQITKVIY